MILTISPDRLSDRDLLAAAERVARDARSVTAELLALLGELDVRRLYLGEACSSLFVYCTRVLHLSEHAAYHRIEAARAARRFPVILDLVAEGALTLTAVALLRPHLTTENHVAVLEAARHRSKGEVQVQVARLAPRPDIPSLVRKVSTLTAPIAAAPIPGTCLWSGGTTEPNEDEGDAPVVAAPARPVVAPLAPDRYLLKVTISGETHAKLRRAQDLLRHVIRNGDPAAILDRALTRLVDELEKSKFARATRAPRAEAQSARPSSRYIPAAVKRAVWSRDQGRCAFIGPAKERDSAGPVRCAETGRLEFHHIIPFADGGPTELDNLSLRCRAHNNYESERWSGDSGRTELVIASRDCGTASSAIR